MNQPYQGYPPQYAPQQQPGYAPQQPMQQQPQYAPPMQPQQWPAQQQPFPPLPQAPQGYPPQYAPQQQFQQPMAPPGYGPQGWQPTQAPGHTNMAPPPAPGAGPFIPSDELIMQGYQRAAEVKQKILQARSGSGKLRFLDIKGPGGNDWKHAFVGFVGGKAIYIMGSWKEGALNYFERWFHFYKSPKSPAGASINATADEDLMDKAHKMALDKGNKEAFGKKRCKYVYQGWPYEYDPNTGLITGVDPSQCMHEDGVIRPLLLEAGSDLHTDIQAIAKARKWVQTFHPDHGRPIAITKTKTGTEQMNVEYKAIDLDQQPLADCFRPGLGYMYMLDELFKPASIEEQIAAIAECGLPMPPEAGGYHGQSQTGYQGQQQQGYAPQQQQISYQQAPQPPAPNPWPQQQFQPPPMQQQQNWPPPQGQPLMQPQFMQPQQPKPLPPLPQGAQGNVASTPMIPPNMQPQQQGMQRTGLQPMPQQQFQQPPMQQQQMGFQNAPPMQQPQQQGPMSPEELQAQMQSGGKAPF